MADEKMGVPYKWGEKIDFSSKVKNPFLCPECSEFSEYVPSPYEDTYFECPNGHKWHWIGIPGKAYMTKWREGR